MQPLVSYLHKDKSYITNEKYTTHFSGNLNWTNGKLSGCIVAAPLTHFTTLLGAWTGTIYEIAKAILPVLHLCDAAVAVLLLLNREDYDKTLNTRKPEKELCATYLCLSL